MWVHGRADTRCCTQARGPGPRNGDFEVVPAGSDTSDSDDELDNLDTRVRVRLHAHCMRHCPIKSGSVVDCLDTQPHAVPRR